MMQHDPYLARPLQKRHRAFVPSCSAIRMSRNNSNMKTKVQIGWKFAQCRTIALEAGQGSVVGDVEQSESHRSTKVTRARGRNASLDAAVARPCSKRRVRPCGSYRQRQRPVFQGGHEGGPLAEAAWRETRRRIIAVNHVDLGRGEEVSVCACRGVGVYCLGLGLDGFHNRTERSREAAAAA